MTERTRSILVLTAAAVMLTIDAIQPWNWLASKPDEAWWAHWEEVCRCTGWQGK